MAGLDLRALWADLSQSNRLYRLEPIASQGTQGTTSLQSLRVEAWTQRETLSQLFELRIVCLSLDASLELKSLIGQPLSLLTVLADGRTTRRSGMVRAAESLGADGGLARYRLTLVPWLWLGTQQGRSQVFQHRSVADLIAQILTPYADAGPFAFSPEVATFLADAPVRTHCTQYRESDFDFLQRLLAEEGLGWRIEEDEAAPMGHKLVIFSANDHQPVDPSSPVRFHRKSSQETSDAVQALVRRMRQSVAQVHLSTWHVDAKRQISASAPARWPVGGERAPRLEYDDIQGLCDQARNWNDSRTVERYASLLMQAAESRADTLLGHSTARTLRAGTRLQISDAPALGLKTAPDLLLDRIEHIGINNLPRDTAAAIAAQLGGLLPHLVFDAQPHAIPSVTAEVDVFGLASTTKTTTALPGPSDLHPAAQTLATAQATGYANSFSAVHRERPWRPAIVAAAGARLHAKPTVHGVQSALVVGPSGETTPHGANELYCNARGDVRVRFHWQRPEAEGEGRETHQDNRSTRWIRVAQRQAGPGMGWQWLPRIGQEVLVRFVDGDIDQPVVVGALYNGRGEGGLAPSPGGEQRSEADTSVFAQARDGAPSGQANLVHGQTEGHTPAWHGASADPQGHRNPAALTGFKTREFGGSGFSQLVFDDSDHQLRIQLHASTGHSQLNLGHLVHQADNHRGSFRGQGMELRTDGYGALRGGKGVLLTTYHASYSGRGGQKLEPTGDLAAGMALMKQVQQLGQALSNAAKTHLTVQMAGHVGTTRPEHSILDQDRAPHAAMLHAVSGMVAGRAVNDAYADAADKNTAIGKGQGQDKVPHTTDAVVALAAKGGLAMVAGQHVQLVAGETVTLGSAGDVNLALADVLRVHSGQAIGVLAGAEKADAADGLSVIASQDDIDVQAQHDELKIQAKDPIKLASTTKTVEIAAKKKIRIATAQGASMTLENGDITFECPGTITYFSSQRKLAGPARLQHALPANPDAAPFQRKYVIRRATDDQPVPHQKYRITMDDGRVIEGVSNEKGETNLAKSDGIQNVVIELLYDRT
ncbi:type VI secretion system Vgr family protein [Variovorax sp. PAMC 28711]|uniref:type VI secretion system Vgr family protein n=1 Tax=Variovorax sp. PAMC 28711 TaxID=1795631 RepID=UPI00078C341B|nr:type VI secretion system Vgr family protein [Variovorax sp. PAMC 28711]AMM25082.1 hypothetical protein AX767_12445 [Variovorax sp. PAMC 28711]